jgi:hypothetical protein
MTRGWTEQAYLDGFRTARSVLDLDRLTIEELLTALKPDQDWDVLLTPWRRGYVAAIRSGFGY